MLINAKWYTLQTMKKLALIFLVALFLRLFNLSSTPLGFHSDEVRVGWNAYSILKTSQDDRANTAALYYNTFGDYRPTGIFYFTIPSIAIFGLNEFAVRFPSSLIGALTVFPVFFICFEFTKNKRASYLSAFFLGISPWSIITSRATSEVVISLFFSLWGIYLFIKAIKTSSDKFIYLSFASLLISFLLYHSIRILAPVMILAIFLFLNNKVKKDYRHMIYRFIASIFLLTILFASTFGSTNRFNQISILKNTDTTVLGIQTASNFNIFRNFSDQYFSYFEGRFLIGDSALPQRYKTQDVGLLLYPELILFLVGVYFSIRYKKHHLVLILLLLSPLAAALTNEDSPNLHRSLIMLPFVEILTAAGLIFLFAKQKLIGVILILLLFINQVFYLKQYFEVTNIANAAVRNYTSKDLVVYLNEVHQNYEQVFVTNDPDDPYPWFAFYNKLDPEEFNKYAIKRNEGPWQYKNIIFGQSECPSGDIFPGPREPKFEKNILVIDGFKCPVEAKLKDGMQASVLKQFINPDGTVGYTAWEKKD